MRRTRVVVGMSGGVDSSVAAWLLKQQGCEVVGVFMKNWEDDDSDEYCTSREDLVDAASVADVVGVELEAVNFAAEYRERVFAHFLRDYAAGRTPNPDVLCNSEIKFRAFLDHALALGADAIATGHYARVSRHTSGRPVLRRGADAAKDQSYFLYDLTAEQLAAAMFPVGEMTKDEVRGAAREAGLPTADKEESMEICFVGSGETAAEFVERRSGAFGVPLPARGRFVGPSGETLGEHAGVHRFTVGQRRGLGVALGEPRYVTAIEPATGEVRLGTRTDLAVSSARVSRVRWTSIETPTAPIRAAVRVRHRGVEIPATITPLPGGEARIDFDAPMSAVAPGQAAVFYRGDTVLGGGTLRR